MTDPFDPEIVLTSLKDFQRRSAEWVFARMFDRDDPAIRFLVADEVGLGKTHVAKGVVAQVIDYLGKVGDERHDIVYICSNAAIARQNVNKLVPKGVEPMSSAERLTLLPLASLASKDGDNDEPAINLLAITPGTSLAFGRSTGRFEERVLAYAFLRELWGASPFSAKRSRWIFFQGIGRENADDRLKNLAKSAEYRNAARTHAKLFSETVEAIDRERHALRLPPIRAMFDELDAKLERYSKGDFPVNLRSLRGEFLSEVRRALATVGISMLQPDLVVLDEFQRFKDLLDPQPENWAADLAKRLFEFKDPETGRPTRTLLLSATPYRMYTTTEDEGVDHYEDFFATCRFLFSDDDRVDGLKIKFAELRSALTSPDRLSLAPPICEEIARELRSVMVRTERLAATPQRDGMLHEVETATTVEKEDLLAYARFAGLSELVNHHDPIEYWKSSPYLFNFMEQYKLKQALDGAYEHPDMNPINGFEPGPGLLDWGTVDKHDELDPENGRLRWLMSDLNAHHAFELLWLAPSLPYYTTDSIYDDVEARSFTKRLIFSGWAVVPKTVSCLVSYEAERRAFSERSHKYSDGYAQRGGSRLTFGQKDGRPTKMTAFLLSLPSSTLAELGDPLVDRRSGAPTRAGVLARIRSDLGERLDALTSSASQTGGVDLKWYWAAPLLLDAQVGNGASKWLLSTECESAWSGGSAPQNFLLHLEEAREVVRTEGADLGRPPDDLGAVLAEVALGGPAVCALRSMAAVTGLAADSAVTLSAAARVAWGLHSFFNAPDVTALIIRQSRLSVQSRAVSEDGDEEESDEERRAGYWRAIVDHAIGGNLQAVLDEHVHVLRDWLGYVRLDSDERRAEAAQAMAERLVDALGVRTTSLKVDIPTDGGAVRTIEDHRMRSRFAAAFGTQRLEDGGEARIESISAAFNSPFWPFVLVSTSVGQEGLDFHLWCHSVVHWNLPTNPVDLEQREGRVHRYKGHAVRKNLAGAATSSGLSAETGDVWSQMFESAPVDGQSEMVPNWVFDGPAKIERHVPVPPLSRDAARLPELRKAVAAYRLAFGQARQEELIEYLGATCSEDELEVLGKQLKIDLRPPT